MYHLYVVKQDQEFFRWREEVCKVIDDWWPNLSPSKFRTAMWMNTVASILCSRADEYVRCLRFPLNCVSLY